MEIVKSSDANEKLIQITTRFTVDEYKAIEDVAKINNRAMSEIIRLCVEKRLPKYLDTIFFYDNEMGEKYRRRDAMAQIDIFELINNAPVEKLLEAGKRIISTDYAVTKFKTPFIHLCVL